MNAKRLLHAVLALILTAGVYFYDLQQRSTASVSEHLAITRQMSLQIETLMLYANTKGEASSIDWVSHILSVGVEPRPISVLPLTNQPKNSTVEKYELDRRKGIFKYSKLIWPEAGEGIQIILHVNPIGFLGARSLWVSDGLIGILFLMMGLCITAIPILISSRKKQPLLKDFVLEWTLKAKTLLTLFGQSLKSLVIQAKVLVETSTRTKTHIENMKLTCRQILETVIGIENQIVDEGLKAPQLESRLLRLKELSEKCLTEADSAFHLYDHLNGTTQKVNQSITETTEKVGQNVKLLKELQDL